MKCFLNLTYHIWARIPCESPDWINILLACSPKKKKKNQKQTKKCQMNIYIALNCIKLSQLDFKKPLLSLMLITLLGTFWFKIYQIVLSKLTDFFNLCYQKCVCILEWIMSTGRLHCKHLCQMEVFVYTLYLNDTFSVHGAYPHTLFTTKLNPFRPYISHLIFSPTEFFLPQK